MCIMWSQGKAHLFQKKGCWYFVQFSLKSLWRTSRFLEQIALRPEVNTDEYKLNHIWRNCKPIWSALISNATPKEVCFTTCLHKMVIVQRPFHDALKNLVKETALHCFSQKKFIDFRVGFIFKNNGPLYFWTGMVMDVYTCTFHKVIWRCCLCWTILHKTPNNVVSIV